MKRFFKYVKPYKTYFILGPLCMIIEVIGEVLMPKLLSLVINNAADKTPLFSVGLAGAMIFVALVMMAGGVGGAYFGAKASVNFAADLRADVYRRVQSFAFEEIDRYSTGSLVTRLTNDVTQLQNIVNMMLRMCLRAPGMLIGGLIMAIILKPDLSAVFAVSIPVMLAAVMGVITRGFKRFSIMQEKVDGLNSAVQESVTNVRVVKSFVREEKETEKFTAANTDLKTSGIRALRIVIFITPIMTLCMNLTVIAVLWFGGNIVIDGGMPIGDLSAFITYVSQILSSLMMITMMLMTSSRALASAKRVEEVLATEPSITDKNAASPDVTVTRGEIEFKNVSFRYFKNSADKVLDNVSLKIPAGYTVGIIGSTGCGKSTLVSLIPRLYDTDEGEVLVDGVNVRDYSLHNLREGVGMVLQKNVLFTGTIEDNLRWGAPDADMSEIVDAAVSAQADKFVREFEGQYNSDIGQGGTNVSGGQKQRLCIARALLKNPKVLILDDSTSAVDTATEAMIRKAFREKLSDSTKIIIAQRISSVMEADMIVVLDEGTVTGTGTHTELMQNCDAYREIYYSQNEKEVSDNGEKS